ncbi:hydroxymethylglutaryl-CoA lyase [Lutibaculum baratangense]|uniref:Hydroxymethylglutaryl-CoA lyase n=1 Tax=Lutibaculum baratangense AMV1 TaxID=631454 RepID=V4RA15_9HYPH|nr:hydroxymethylglutaryl-CoA lyase [Lutibaculum baratangense]ESR23006.1 Hydroxymethylglutaryl-CoA lyase [Lutibaculum baratangense AMV1]
MGGAVTICECFARDGLQHETVFVPTEEKVALIEAFADAGFPRVEATSYSHPGRVPAFADASELLQRLKRRDGVWYKATCPNERAVVRAVADLDQGFGANELSLLVSATESHTERNLRATRQEQWARVERMVEAAGRRFRLVGVISVALGCPFEGDVDPASVAADAARFRELGVTHVTIGDTIGAASPRSTKALFSRLAADFPDMVFIGHFHDTRGTALVNCLAALEEGCRWLDSAFGGVGGHPAEIEYGKGFTGNVATEDLVALLEAEGFRTGVDLDRMMRLSERCEHALRRPLYSKVARAGLPPSLERQAAYG